MMRSTGQNSTTRRRSKRSWLVLGLLSLLSIGVPAPGWGQDSAMSTATPPDPTRAQATRAELQASLSEAEAISKGSGQPAADREQKRAEAALIRQRLQEGDLQVGDQVILSVQGESTLTGTFTVDGGRNLAFPNLPPIPVQGVLRAELKDHLTEQLKRFLRQPVVKVTSTIRLSLLGSVGKPGFYQVPADMLLSDAIMQAGGPPAETDKSVVRRGTTEIVSTDAFQTALTSGRTLDQLNLRAGDEIFLEAKQPKDLFRTIRTYAAIPALILSTYGVGKLVGIF